MTSLANVRRRRTALMLAFNLVVLVAVLFAGPPLALAQEHGPTPASPDLIRAAIDKTSNLTLICSKTNKLFNKTNRL